MESEREKGRVKRREREKEEVRRRWKDKGREKRRFEMWEIICVEKK